ncbi:MAG: helix-turn-helix domain-containing protein [Pseudomonadota bacterium]
MSYLKQVAERKFSDAGFFVPRDWKKNSVAQGNLNLNGMCRIIRSKIVQAFFEFARLRGFKLKNQLGEEVRISRTALAVSDSLLNGFYNQVSGQCNPSFAALAKTMKCNRDTARKAFYVLRDVGFLRAKYNYSPRLPGENYAAGYENLQRTNQFYLCKGVYRIMLKMMNHTGFTDISSYVPSVFDVKTALKPIAPPVQSPDIRKNLLVAELLADADEDPPPEISPLSSGKCPEMAKIYSPALDFYRKNKKSPPC